MPSLIIGVVQEQIYLIVKLFLVNYSFLAVVNIDIGCELLLVALVLGAMRLLCSQLVGASHRLVRFGLYLQAKHQGFVV